MPYEGKRADEIPDRVEMRHGRAPAGSYTDDTQMMIALAESLVRCGAIDAPDLAAAFRAQFAPERGYGSGTRTVMSLWAAGVPVDEAAGRLMNGEGSLRNGAAMRVAPVAVRFVDDAPRVVSEAARSALLTHAHPEGVDGAVVQAVAVAAALRGQDPLAAAMVVASTHPMRCRIRELSVSTTPELDRRALTGTERRVGYTATESVPVAVVIGSRAGNFEEAVSIAVRCGGDTDTVAAMAGAVAGARFGATSIPPRWYDALEDGERGRTHVERLAIALIEPPHATAPHCLTATAPR